MTDVNKIIPRPRQWEALRADEARISGPIVMVNLLRFKPQGGAQAYNRYLKAAQPVGQRLGARHLMFLACEQLAIGPEGERWDAVLIVEYPSLKAFLDMNRDKEYQAAALIRRQGLEDTRLIMATPGAMVDGWAVIPQP